MLTLEDLVSANEKAMMLQGLAGDLETKVNGGQAIEADKPMIALLCHPHSLHGGTMNNKVVTTLAKAFKELEIPSIRFNFRGVGRSQGDFDQGVGESNDLLKIMADLESLVPDHQLILAGFSFGAYVSYRAAWQNTPALLMSIAPAVNHGDFRAYDTVPKPWHVLVADQDEIVPKEDILAWHQLVKPKPSLHRFAESSHFFHGQLIELKQTIKNIAQEII